MSDNANSSAGKGCEFTREELSEALPYLSGRLSNDRFLYVAPACPYCHETPYDLRMGFLHFRRFPKAVFVRCHHCHRVYFRPDCQEPALMRSPLRQPSQKCFAGLFILLAGNFLGAYAIFKLTEWGGTAFLVALALLILAAMLFLYISDAGTTAAEIRASQKRLESTEYLAALRDRGIELPYYYLRQLEKIGEAAENNDEPAPGP